MLGAGLEAKGAKLVMIGDPQQLQAIEAGAAFRGIAERTDTDDLQRYNVTGTQNG